MVMTLMDITAGWLGHQLFATPVDGELWRVLLEMMELWTRRPELLDLVARDQGRAGKRSRRRRREDREAAKRGSPTLIEVDEEPESPGGLDPLGEGRPRMRPEVVLAFLALRGLTGSVCSRTAVDRYRDSITLWAFLARFTDRFPGTTTILENLNVLSDDTLDAIHAAQLEEAMKDGLADYEVTLGDSTAVEANSAYPTDSGLILRDLVRAFTLAKRLHKFGLDDFRDGRVPGWLRRLKRRDLEINTAKGKKGAERKRRRGYRDVVDIAEKTIRWLSKEKEAREEKVASRLNHGLSPRRRRALEKLWDELDLALEDAYCVMTIRADKLANGDGAEEVEEWERRHSRSDRSARFIRKGGRETVFGYKPQLAQSREGLITGVLVEKGDPADSTFPVELIKEHRRTTGVTPRVATFDDGYSGKARREEGLALEGLEVYSVNGSKGKAMTPTEDWESDEYKEARRIRAACESPIFVLKNNHDFRRLRRRGLDPVRRELTEKIIAYNFHRIAVLRERRREEAAKPKSPKDRAAA
jgi:hypothetical protein